VRFKPGQLISTPSGTIVRMYRPWPLGGERIESSFTRQTYLTIPRPVMFLEELKGKSQPKGLVVIHDGLLWVTEDKKHWICGPQSWAIPAQIAAAPPWKIVTAQNINEFKL